MPSWIPPVRIRSRITPPGLKAIMCCPRIKFGVGSRLPLVKATSGGMGESRVRVIGGGQDDFLLPLGEGQDEGRFVVVGTRTLTPTRVSEVRETHWAVFGKTPRTAGFQTCRIA